MTRPTSIAAYTALKESGCLGRRQMQVYEAVFDIGPCTANEALKFVNEQPGQKEAKYYSSHARFAELRRMGLLQEVGTKKCSVSGNVVICWEVTEKDTPKKLEPRIPVKRKLELLEEAIRSTCDTQTFVMITQRYQAYLQEEKNNGKTRSNRSA